MTSENYLNSDGPPFTLSEDQVKRKTRSEGSLEARGIKINPYLPCIENEGETELRIPREIARRVCILAVTNLVAFSELPEGEAREYLEKYKLWDFVTPVEKVFLSNPTDDDKSRESWKCESIWTLLWALSKVDDLGFPDKLCDLNYFSPDEYPFGKDKDPKLFINSSIVCRSKAEILDMADLYYRFEWACVDATLNGVEIETIHPGVVYERHHALNWLINYMGQDWDNVTCDT